MFCEKYESDADCAAAEIIGGAFPVEFSDGLRERIDLPEGGEIIDCWTEPVPNPKLSAEGKICFGAKICVFVKTADGDIAYYEKSVEREVAPPAAGHFITSPRKRFRKITRAGADMLKFPRKFLSRARFM